MSIGKRVRELREMHGLTIMELAEKLGVGKSSISNWERGKCDPSLINAISLADIFDLSLDDLVGR